MHVCWTLCVSARHETRSLICGSCECFVCSMQTNTQMAADASCLCYSFWSFCSHILNSYYSWIVQIGQFIHSFSSIWMQNNLRCRKCTYIFAGWMFLCTRTCPLTNLAPYRTLSTPSIVQSIEQQFPTQNKYKNNRKLENLEKSCDIFRHIECI